MKKGGYTSNKRKSSTKNKKDKLRKNKSRSRTRTRTRTTMRTESLKNTTYSPSKYIMNRGLLI